MSMCSEILEGERRKGATKEVRRVVWVDRVGYIG